MVERVLGPLAKRWKWLRTAISVQQRFGEIHGGYLAASITLTAFLSMFPLLLLVIAVVGFVSERNTHFVTDVIAQLGLQGESATLLSKAVATAQKSKGKASIFGIVGLLWSGLGLVAALGFAFDSVWQAAGRGMKDKLYGVAWLGGAALVITASVAATAGLKFLPVIAKPFGIVIALMVNVGLWLWTFKVLTNRDIGWKPLLPGAIFGAAGLEVLKLVGGIYVPRAVAASSALYGSIGIIFAILAWLLFFGRLVVYAAVLNVIRWEEDHGTVSIEIEVPKVPGEVPVEANRAGEAEPTD